ncbi:hypothetical protein L228DRAFT_244877 [Xylona heveae TC161]|uniref:Uncharacterized protein n=1 Tax=Xylona heveae (strain CBS 132557 / TC161) TaxID=1328760 RepID=A0A165HWA3_XYLHT|nr:hypothetical protein L228DRAFT_244877 [Xylona heveae TC161]KZF24014.1 hypothetical protein L228DRAFT_244877 [Xylona heveae TC161]
MVQVGRASERPTSHSISPLLSPPEKRECPQVSAKRAPSGDRRPEYEARPTVMPLPDHF